MSATVTAPLTTAHHRSPPLTTAHHRSPPPRHRLATASTTDKPGNLLLCHSHGVPVLRICDLGCAVLVGSTAPAKVASISCGWTSSRRVVEDVRHRHRLPLLTAHHRSHHQLTTAPLWWGD